MEWDPGQYQIFTEQRTLPFRHLMAALDHLEPATVVDLGCGPGSLTATMLERWPEARIVGVDSSHEMIALADRRRIHDRLRFELGEVETWRAGDPVDLLFSNACFQWLDNHRALLDHLLPQLAAGGTLAFQVPANHTEPSHTLLGELCSSPRWRQHVDGMPRTGVRELDWYRAELGDRGFAVTAWQTTYHH
jgi:trans-aconitate 2-methyltransferase